MFHAWEGVGDLSKINLKLLFQYDGGFIAFAICMYVLTGGNPNLIDS